MLGTLALIIGVSTIGMATLLAYSGGLNVYSLATMVILFNAAILYNRTLKNDLHADFEALGDLLGPVSL